MNGPENMFEYVRAMSLAEGSLSEEEHDALYLRCFGKRRPRGGELKPEPPHEEERRNEGNQQPEQVRDGIGEFSTTVTRTVLARRRILEAIQDIAPQVLKDLRDRWLNWNKPELSCIEYSDCTRSAKGLCDLRWKNLEQRDIHSFDSDCPVCGAQPGVMCHFAGPKGEPNRSRWHPERKVTKTSEYFCPDVPRVEKALHDWAKDYHIDEEWVIRAARETLAFWYWSAGQEFDIEPLDSSQPPESAEFIVSPAGNDSDLGQAHDLEPPEWCLPGLGVFDQIVDGEVDLGIKPFVFKCFGWDYTRESKKDVKDRLKKALRFYGYLVDNYLNEIETTAKSLFDHGIQKAKAKRDRSGSPTIHFQWLVSYQVLKKEYEDIAQEYTDSDPSPSEDRVIGTDTIVKAVRNLAREAGLILRK